MSRKIKFRVWDKCHKQMWEVFKIDFSNDELICTMNIKRRFNEVELMQSTGLKDRNGVEIYEGDIVLFVHEIGDQDYSSETYTVEFGNGTFNISWAFEDNTCDECTVIGNVFENPELLEVKP